MRISDWSSDVCSSDLPGRLSHAEPPGRRALRGQGAQPEAPGDQLHPDRQAAAPAAAHGGRDRGHGGGGDSHRGRGAAARKQPHQAPDAALQRAARSEEHTSELQSLMRTSYAVFCLKKKKSIIANCITHYFSYEYHEHKNDTSCTNTT